MVGPTDPVIQLLAVPVWVGSHHQHPSATRLTVMSHDVALPATPTETTPEPRRMHPVALLAALAAVVVPIMSVFSVNVALRQIGVELDASAGTLQLVVAAYGVVYAALVVIGGRLGDSYGR